MVDVMADILRVASKPSSKTRILYSANLSYEQAKKYCDLLVDMGMLSKLEPEDKGGEKFQTTTNGKGFLTQMSRFGRISPGERSVWEREAAQV
jgi:predicted transcriptional regulator